MIAEEWRLLGFYAVSLLYEPTFRKNFGSYKKHIPEDAILHCHRRENLKLFTLRLFVWCCHQVAQTAVR
jgi:hypothetical protein